MLATFWKTESGWTRSNTLRLERVEALMSVVTGWGGLPLRSTKAQEFEVPLKTWVKILRA